MLKSRSVEQLLAVLNSFAGRYDNGEKSAVKAFQGAVDDVRKKYGVAYQTIGDLCRRRLKLRSINEFYNLLEQWKIFGNFKPLEETIKRNAKSETHQKITDFFAGTHNVPFVGDVSKSSLPEESFTFHLRTDIAKKLKILSVGESFSIPLWLSKKISQTVEEQYKGWISKEKVE
jgi:hypothetical protein